MIRAILACDSQGGIAKQGGMPWPHNKKDLQHFANLTRGNTVVMGRATWDAPDMPCPLKGRKNVVATRNSAVQAPGAVLIHHDIPNEIKALAESETVFIIGGANLFTQLIDIIDILYLSRITGSYDCDTFLPMDLISNKFEMIDQIKIDNQLCFELYLKGK